MIFQSFRKERNCWLFSRKSLVINLKMWQQNKKYSATERLQHNPGIYFGCLSVVWVAIANLESVTYALSEIVTDKKNDWPQFTQSRDQRRILQFYKSTNHLQAQPPLQQFQLYTHSHASPLGKSPWTFQATIRLFKSAFSSCDAVDQWQTTGKTRSPGSRSLVPCLRD